MAAVLAVHLVGHNVFMLTVFSSVAWNAQENKCNRLGDN